MPVAAEKRPNGIFTVCGLLILVSGAFSMLRGDGPSFLDNKGLPDNKGDATEGAAPSTNDSSLWPAFRGGPQLHGYRDVKISDSPKLVWTYDTNAEIESSAAIQRGVAYVGSTEGELLALDLHASSRDGKLIWKYTAEGSIRTSPGIHRGRVYFGDDLGFIHAVDAKTGKGAWKYETEGGAEIISSPNFSDNLVLIGSYDGNLYCLDATTGKEKWKFLTGAAVHCTPAIAEGKTFVAGCDEMLRVVDIKTGKEAVKPMELGVNTAASPAVDGAMLYVGTFASQVVAINWKKGEGVWAYEHPTRHFPFYSSAALTDELVVIGGRDRLMHAIDRKTGKTKWTFPTRARIESSPLVARDRVLFGSNDKKLYLLDIETGNEIWHHESDGGFPASPALAEGRVVIGSDSGLIYCFDVTTGAASKKDAPKSSGNKKDG